MAASTAPLVWDFYREIGMDVDVKVGGVVHFYDEQAQSLFLNDGLKTRTSTVSDGQWETAVMSEPSTFINTNPYTSLGLDHPCNGILYGVAIEAGKLVFLRYIYAMDLAPILDSWSWTTQVDNAIAQFTANVQNIGPDIFGDEVTLFQPGARITLAIKMGESEAYPIGVARLDECSYEVNAELVPLSGRNSIGFCLKDQTFDDVYEYTGTSDAVVKAIFDYAGIKKYSIQPGEGSMTYTFKPEMSLLEGIQQMIDYFTGSSLVWAMAELADGTVCVGYDWWVASKQANSYYSFYAHHDVFRRKTSKMSDGCYTAVRVTGKSATDTDLTPVMAPITNFPYWALGAHRTKHIQAPKGFTQAELQIFAEMQAAAYQYVGIGEDLTGPFRPQLLVGDVAEVVDIDGVQGTSLGVITEVRQVFGRKDGYKTEFSVDSGGVVTDGENYSIYSRMADINGFNRRLRIMDLVRFVSGK